MSAYVLWPYRRPPARCAVVEEYEFHEIANTPASFVWGYGDPLWLPFVRVAQLRWWWFPVRGAMTATRVTIVAPEWMPFVASRILRWVRRIPVHLGMVKGVHRSPVKPWPFVREYKTPSEWVSGLLRRG